VRRAHADLTRVFWAFPTGPEVVKVEILPQQWAWNIRYAGPDGRFGTSDDVTTLNDLRLPVDTPVVVELKAKDVIHSFYLPNLRVKQDAIPGQITKTWFQSRKTGRYEIACAQMCGWAHYKMRGVVTFLPADEYQKWLADVSDDARRLYDPNDAEAHWGWPWKE
jgi:cytochrome c oxidase subunit 2